MRANLFFIQQPADALSDDKCQWHFLVCLVGRITDHDSLIACAEVAVRQRAVHSGGDVGGLFVYVDVNVQVVRSFLAKVFPPVSDLSDDVVYDLAVFNLRPGRDLAPDDDVPCSRHDLYCYAGVGVGLQMRVQYRVGDLVTEFVRMAAPDGFCGHEPCLFILHGCLL